MKLYCPKCAHEISAQNMNLSQLVAKCERCDSLFSFADQVPTKSSTFEQAPIPVPQPDKINVDYQGNQLILTWRWFHWSVIFLTFFMLFWNSIVLSFVGAGLLAVLKGQLAGLAVLALPHVWVGVWLIYYVATRYINSTTLIVANGELLVKYGPIPSWGNKTISTFGLSQLYTKSSSSIFKQGRNGWYGNIELYAITKDGQHEMVLSGLDNADIGLFIEQTVEKFLNIENRPVRGAL